METDLQPSAVTPVPRTRRAAQAHVAIAIGGLLAGCLTACSPAEAGSTLPRVVGAEQLHAEAAKHFRDGRYPAAYGRFVALADAGHAASARAALFMCQQGPTLIGSDWDCAPDQVESWAAAAGVAAPTIVSPAYGPPRAARPTGASQGARR